MSDVTSNHGARVIGPSIVLEHIQLQLTAAEAGATGTFRVKDFPNYSSLLSGTGDLQVAVSDIDSATALVWDLGIGDSDEVIDTTIISGSTVGRSAGVDENDAAAAPIDVSEKSLIFEITTGAGTGVAGTVDLYFRHVAGSETIKVNE